MSLLRRAQTQLETRAADPTLPWGSSYIPTNGQTGLSAAGIPMTDDRALSITTVFACVRILSTAVANTPVALYNVNKAGVKTRATNQPLLLTDPWPEGTLYDFWTQVVVSLAFRGNSYNTVAARDPKTGQPIALTPVHPDRVIAYRDRATGQRVYGVDGKLIPNQNMVHIPNMLTPGQFVGLNPVEYARTSWALASAAEAYGAQFFANSANPSGILTVDEDLSPEETLKMLWAWKQGHQGVGGAALPAVLSGGAKWTQISITPDDAQFLQTRQQQDQDILAWFGVPAHMISWLDRTASWGQTLEVQEMGFVINTLGSYCKKISAYLGKFMPPNTEIIWDFSHRLKPDAVSMAQINQIGHNGGWLNADEVRASMNLPPLPNGLGQTYLQPMNMQPSQGDNDPIPPAPPNDSGLDNGGGTNISNGGSGGT